MNWLLPTLPRLISAKVVKLYYLNSVVNNTGDSHSIKEWHEILGHCNVKDVVKLETVVEGMKKFLTSLTSV